MAKHLTLPERKILQQLISRNVPRAEIARIMNRDRSTIYREINRNAGRRGYSAQQAQRLYCRRRLSSRRPCKLDDPELRHAVRHQLSLRWSPDQIAGRLRCNRRSRWRVSGQTIYTWIKRCNPSWRQWLRRGGRKPEKRGKLPSCVSIQDRPPIIDDRLRYGDWEGDTMVGPKRGSAVLTVVERKSGMLLIGKMCNMTSEEAARAAYERMHSLPKNLRRSITFDNGKEFAQHQKMAQQLEVEVYFAQPRSPWQRGTNENTNGLIRQFFPKGTDFRRISHHEVARVERLLNERPRKRLGYKTPLEVLAKRLCCN